MLVLSLSIFKQYIHNNTIEFHKSMHSNSHCIRISASCFRRDTPASKPQQVYRSENLASMTKTARTIGSFAQGYSGLKGLFLPLLTVEWMRGRNLWKCQLFSYLRCIYSLKMWQNVLQDRNKDVKMKLCPYLSAVKPSRHVSLTFWDLLPPTGYSVYWVQQSLTWTFLMKKSKQL